MDHRAHSVQPALPAKLTTASTQPTAAQRLELQNIRRPATQGNSLLKYAIMTQDKASNPGELSSFLPTKDRTKFLEATVTLFEEQNP